MRALLRRDRTRDALAERISAQASPSVISGSLALAMPPPRRSSFVLGRQTRFQASGRRAGPGGRWDLHSTSGSLSNEPGRARRGQPGRRRGQQHCVEVRCTRRRVGDTACYRWKDSLRELKRSSRIATRWLKLGRRDGDLATAVLYCAQHVGA